MKKTFGPMPALKVGYVVGNRKGDILLYMGNNKTYEISADEGWSVGCNHDPITGLNRANCREFDIMFVCEGAHVSLNKLRKLKLDEEIKTSSPYLLWYR